MEATKATSEWEHSHALNELDTLSGSNGEFTVVEIRSNGDVRLKPVDNVGTTLETEGAITNALAHGELERVSDGKSHELASC